MLIPVKGKMFWPKNIKGLVLPLLVKKMFGRLAKKRKRELFEENIGTKLSKVDRVMTCGYCHEKDHNKLRCLRRIEFVKVLLHI